MSERGIVTSVSSRSCQVHVEGLGDLRCTLRGVLWDDAADESRPVAVGDRVWLHLERGEGVIERRELRGNRLARPQARGSRQRAVQVIAANLDRLLVVASLADPPFREGLVDRFLVAAALQEIPPVLVLNKVDLEGAGEPPARREIVQPYRDFGYRVLETSCQSGEGLAELRELMSAGLSLLVGHSGVGKSSLLNAISPGLDLQTSAVAGYHGRGRHTTTRVSLLHLDGGGWVVDSPGIREFGVTDLGPGDLARLYPGFGALPEGCRFSNCLHRQEPDCAVRAAVTSGALLAERHERYLRLLEDVERQSQPYSP
jgi:ribosome biogenesis GTPase